MSETAEDQNFNVGPELQALIEENSRSARTATGASLLFQEYGRGIRRFGVDPYQYGAGPYQYGAGDPYRDRPRDEFRYRRRQRAEEYARRYRGSDVGASELIYLLEDFCTREERHSDGSNHRERDLERMYQEELYLMRARYRQELDNLRQEMAAMVTSPPTPPAPREPVPLPEGRKFHDDL